MLFALVYLLLRRVVRLIARSSNDQTNTEVEVVVLRHQLMVLKRQVGRPRLRRRDRLFTAAISRPFLEIGGHRSSSVRRRSFAGTGTSCGGSGPSGGGPSAEGRRSQVRFES